MAELTESMIDALKALARDNGRQKPSGAKASTMTALVKRGLVDRDSLKVIERRYSSEHGYDTLQVRIPKGWWLHEYWVTPSGFAALEEADRAG